MVVVVTLRGIKRGRPAVTLYDGVIAGWAARRRKLNITFLVFSIAGDPLLFSNLSQRLCMYNKYRIFLIDDVYVFVITSGFRYPIKNNRTIPLCYI